MRGPFAILVLLGLLAGPARAGNPWDAVAAAAGHYEGRAASGGEIVAVETRIATMPEGRMEGSYSYIQDGKTYHGSLSHGRVAGPTTLVFIWHDNWGFGVLTLHFSPDFDSFVGAWGPLDDSAETYPWVGRKIRAGERNASSPD